MIVSVFDSLFLMSFGSKGQKKEKENPAAQDFLVILYRSFTLDSVMLLA